MVRPAGRDDGTPRRRAAQSVIEDLDALVDDILVTISAQIPAYRTLTADQLTEVTAIAGWGIRRILDLWAHDQGDPTAADLNRFRGIGAARALDDRPLAGVLRAYRLAGQRITDTIARDHSAGLTFDDAMALARLWMGTVDALSEALHEGHTEAERRLEADRSRALADLLADLLDGRQVTITALADRARRLGLVLPPRPVVTVVEPPSGADPEAVMAEVLTAADLRSDESVLRGVRDRRPILLHDPTRSQAIRSAVSARPGTHGATVAASRPADVQAAYRLADQALSRAPGYAFTHRALLNDGDALLIALLGADPPPALLVAPAVLGELLDPANRHLLEGLDAHLHTGSAVAAADHLGVHPQTIRYRIRRVQELTSRDLKDPWDRFALQAARLATPPTR